MIERVARVLYEDEIGAGFDETYDERKTRFLDKARRAITAMREPTDEMCQAFYEAAPDQWEPTAPTVGWKAMIDEVLG